MGVHWQELKKCIDEENERILKVPPEDVVRVYKFDIVRSGAGTGGNMAGVWFEGATASRYVGPYYVHNVLKLALDPSFSVNQIKGMLRLLLPKVVATARLCGMETLGRFSSETLACLETMENRDDVLALANSLYLYGSSMNAWIHHYMKWALGLAFPINSARDIRDMWERIDECYDA